MTASRMPHLTILAPAASRAAEIIGKAIAGKLNANVHTEGAFNPTAHQAALTIKTA